MANYCNILVREANRTIVPWSVIPVEPTVNFSECFEEVKSGKFSNVITSVELSSCILRSAFIGQDKATANSAVEITVNVVSVCSVFGWHIKFIVSVPEQGESSSHDVLKNAFSIMMESQRRICAQTLPQPISEKIKRTNSNDLLQLANRRGLRLAHNDIESARKYFMTLTSTLWYIDGHHVTLSDRRCEIPELFQELKGYNTPEISKHRKREHTNLQAEKLTSLTGSLYDYLLTTWLKSPQWSVFYEATELLANSLNSYLEYLKKNEITSQCRHNKR